ncbi:MAG: DUF1330 domain-containing protein [Ignavibacteriales bacterium]|nr:DUF1330 domain-containing protein [Ignavibacteriales bacterium]
MSAYVIVDINVKDQVRYEEYKKLAEDTVHAYGGKYIVRGKPVEVLEGDWIPKRLVVLEFPSVTRAKEWWSSAEYAKPKRLRYDTAESKMIVVEGT